MKNEELEVENILPNGWSKVQWGNITDIKNGKHYINVLNENGKYPIYGSSGIINYADEYLCNEDTVIVGRKGTINKPLFVKEKFWNIDTAFGIESNQEVLNPLYLYYFCLNFDFMKLNQSTAIPSLTKSNLQKIYMPLAPINEQKRIVAKIEKLFSNLDNSDKYLFHLEKQLKRYRQSVLKSAFEGELTKEWREKQTNLETADELLEKIKIERILYVENEIREKFKDKTEKWIKDKVKNEVDKFYSTLKPIEDDEKPFSIPSLWKWVRFDELSKKITDGTHFSPTNTDKGDYKYITAKHIKYNGIKLDNLTFVTKEVHKEIYSRCNPEFGDILLIKDGATTGVCTINTLTEEFSMLSSVALIKNFMNIKNRYILNYLRSSVLYSFIRNDMKGVGITRVTLAQLKNFIFPICSLKEQNQIVDQIEKHFSIIDKLETVVQQSIKESKRLRQSILKQAFEGKLVEQDPNDESASILLEKIAKAKEEYQKAMKRKK